MIKASLGSVDYSSETVALNSLTFQACPLIENNAVNRSEPLARNNSGIEFNKNSPGFLHESYWIGLQMSTEHLQKFFSHPFPLLSPGFSLLDNNESPLTYLTGIFKYLFHLKMGTQIPISLKNMLRKNETACSTILLNSTSGVSLCSQLNPNLQNFIMKEYWVNSITLGICGGLSC